MSLRRVEIKDVLCPTDFSEFSERALRHASALALQFGARLKVLHVMPLAPHYEAGLAFSSSSPAFADRSPRDLATEQLRRFVEPCLGLPIVVSVELREGEPWREICSEADTLPADLLVMGTHGRGGFERFILGSVTEKVLRRANCPVLTVCHEEGRTWEAPGLLSRILCATDLAESSGRTIDFALSLAAEKQARVTVLHVVAEVPTIVGGDDPVPIPDARQLTEDAVELAERQLHDALPDEAGTWCETRERVETGQAHETILQVAAEERSDLIVVGARRVGALGQLLFGSTLQHVVRGATCPVLAVRPPTRRSPRLRASIVQVTTA